jgi:hypothetical protein
MANHLPPTKLDRFHKFSHLPAELRTIIWQLAVPVQNRLVDCPSLRRIKRAPCPVLFLVCREAKLCAETQYQRLQLYKKVYDLVMGDFVSIDGNKGLPVSLDHDIFVIQDRKWRYWITNKSDPAQDAEASRKQRKKLSEACKKIENFSAKGVRRVCVTCVVCRSGILPKKDEDGWLRDLCLTCSNFCENIFYPSSRGIAYLGKDIQNWRWQWTHRVQEVSYIRHKWDVAKQIFPPTGPCECSLCQPRTRMDKENLERLNGERLDSLDYNRHDTLFSRSY